MTMIFGVTIDDSGCWECPNCETPNAESTVHGVPNIGEMVTCEECDCDYEITAVVEAEDVDGPWTEDIDDNGL